MRKLLPILVAAALAFSFSACDKLPGKQAASFQNTDVTGLDYAKGFSLTDHTGKPRTLADYKGKVVIVFFGYTQCPDVCPTTMAEMAGVMQKLGPQADQVQVLFITLDPERDTQPLLASYVPAFDKRFVGLYGTPEQTAKTAKDFKVFFSKVPGKDPGSYTIDHMAGSYVFDRDGRLRLFIRHGGSADAIVHDIRQLLS
jgi:protein SCO1